MHRKKEKPRKDARIRKRLFFFSVYGEAIQRDEAKRNRAEALLRKSKAS
jgi:hypothetical protein